MHSSPLICAHADIKQNHSLAVSRAEASTYIYPPPTSSSQLPSQVIFFISHMHKEKQFHMQLSDGNGILPHSEEKPS